MQPTVDIVQLVVKGARYVPFVAYALLVILSRTVLGPRHARAAVLMGSAAAVGMVAWLGRYFIEQWAPEPTYRVEPTTANLLAVAAPGLVHDFLAAAALAVAFAAVVTLVPKER